ncbi:histidine phosphatase family protein [Olsenella massiliensis]|uniref:histidine phosphatase family protein n=1 Tax=Olsenella massiliensis TaxID=1622075 RepID=UPI00071DBB32|nr:histidine phosphatase family protein [Olsenella massiliensis]
MMRRHRILAMRHPETLANVAHTLSGRKDVDLTERGEAQMARAVRALCAWGPDRLWTSPLSRCRAVAEEASALLGVPCTVVEDLQEIEFGSAQDLTLEELERRGLSFPWRFGADGRSRPAPGAESFEELLERGHAVLDLLRPLDGATACVTHGGLSRALVGAALGASASSFWNLRVANVSSLELSCDGDAFTLCSLGLSPEELMERCRHPERAGTDVADAFRKDTTT